MKIGHPKDFWGGVLFAALGLMFLVIARGVPGLAFMPGYAMGTPARMGPGFFPFWLGTILFLLGVVIAVGGVRSRGGPGAQLEKWHWKPLFYVLGSIVAFGLLLKVIGMLLSGIVLIIGASLGSHEFKLKPALVLAVALT